MTLPPLIDTNAKVRDLLNAHNQLDGYQEVVTDKNGNKASVPKSFIFPVRTIVDITKNIKALREHVTAANELRDEVLKRVSDGTNEIDGEKEPQKLREFAKEEAAIWDTEVEVKGLCVLKLESLLNGPLDEEEDAESKDRKKEKAPNRIPQTALASLSPVLDVFQPEKTE